MVTVTRDGDWPVVTWSGDVDISNVAAFEYRTLGAVQNTDAGLTVDLSAVHYVDSAGIRSLLNMRRLLEDRQLRMFLVIPSGSVLTRALEIGGVVAVIPIYRSPEAAQSDRYS